MIGHGLRHMSERDARRADDGAAVGREVAGQQGHQGRLADAVAPDETNPLTLLHMQVGGIEKRFAAQIERDAL